MHDDELYPFPTLDGDNPAPTTATESVEWCLRLAEDAASEARTAIRTAREFVTKDFGHAYSALQLAFERRVAMHAWVQFTRAYHVIACAWEAFPSSRGFEVVTRLQALEQESDLMTEAGEQITRQFGASEKFEACR